MEINNVLSQMRALTASMDLPAATPKPTDDSFGQLLQQSIAKVNEQQSVATSMMTDFQNGEPGTSVAEVMVSMQKASLSFTAMTQVRNKLVDAYQEIMNMPI
jgi:flagellar hook-basal body complex protein FliE